MPMPMDTTAIAPCEETAQSLRVSIIWVALNRCASDPAISDATRANLLGSAIVHYMVKVHQLGETNRECMRRLARTRSSAELDALGNMVKKLAPELVNSCAKTITPIPTVNGLINGKTATEFFKGFSVSVLALC
ncbi:MAG: hypothetical protein AB7G06_05040 [Bdellovibrionales bacterium]